MIKSIKIRNVATFNYEGVTIDNLQKVNVIYGSNGTGKSTISKVLDNPMSIPDCKVEWEDGTPLQIMAYNKEFKEANFQEHLKGIFTLGKATKEEMEELSQMRVDLKQIVNEGKGYKAQIDNQQEEIKKEGDSLKDYLWKYVYKEYEEFSSAMSGSRQKESFKKKILDTYAVYAEENVTYDELKNKYKTLFGETLIAQPQITVGDYSNVDELENNVIWNKVIVGKQNVDIAALIQRLGISDWVSQGQKYITKDSNVCPFCQQHTITKDFKAKLDSFFDEEYKINIRQIESMIQAYQNATNAMIDDLQHIVGMQKIASKTFLEVELVESKLLALRSMVKSNIDIMIQKKKEPSQKANISMTKDIFVAILQAVQKANEEIVKYNKLVSNVEKEKSDISNSIWMFLTKNAKGKIEEFNQKIVGCNKAIENLGKKKDVALAKYRELEAKIKTRETNVTSVKPTVDEINKLLKGLGFTNFSIQEASDAPNYYQIVRENGEVANNSLSEGEVTFVTFLYYRQLVKGSFSRDSVSNNRVLVIDDPVSSLDSSVLFVVSTLVRDMFAEAYEGNGPIKQVILLTHNVYFQKEVAFKGNHCSWKDTIAHYVLRKKDNISSIQAYGKRNPIKSSYELMWNELKNMKLHSCIVVQNVMRRIIENYFHYFGGMSNDVILDKFTNHEERQICRSLLTWVNDGSHTLPEDLYVEKSEDYLVKQMDVFKKIFYAMGQSQHYEMMMGQEVLEDESCVIE